MTWRLTGKSEVSEWRDGAAKSVNKTCIRQEMTTIHKLYIPTVSFKLHNNCRISQSILYTLAHASN